MLTGSIIQLQLVDSDSNGTNRDAEVLYFSTLRNRLPRAEVGVFVLMERSDSARGHRAVMMTDIVCSCQRASRLARFETFC